MLFFGLWPTRSLPFFKPSFALHGFRVRDARLLSGAGAIEGVQGYAGLGNAVTFSGNMLRNDSVGGQSDFTFTGLGAHNSVSIGFLLAAIDS